MFLQACAEEHDRKNMVIANLTSVLISYVSLFPLLSCFTNLTEVTSEIPDEREL